VGAARDVWLADRAAGDGRAGAWGHRALSREAERLSKSCRRLVWLNPLLRYEGFEPRAGGVRALLPYVDAFLPVHNLDSLQDLAAQLTARSMQGRRRNGEHNVGIERRAHAAGRPRSGLGSTQ